MPTTRRAPPLRALAAATVAVGAAATVLACSATGPGTTSASSSRPSPDPGSGRAITLAVAGDVHFEGASAAALRPGGLAAITPQLRDADVTVVNLETAITTRGTAAPKQFTFRAPPRALGVLRRAGVDVVGMANNHALDYGQTGLTDTLAASTAEGLPVIGLGQDADAAYRPWTTTVRGHRVAVLAATQVLDESLATAWTATATHPGLASARAADDGDDRLVAAVARARRSADSVVVLLHWGREREDCPLPRQEELAARLVAAGADAVVGSHAHVLLGSGYLRAGGRTGYVAYGLGNFVFYARPGPGAQTGVLRLHLGPSGEVDDAAWRPALVRSGVPVPLTGAAADDAVAGQSALRSCTDLAASPSAAASTAASRTPNG